jgi:hypothetical protein
MRRLLSDGEAEKLAKDLASLSHLSEENLRPL